jgi:hypothetical protein
LSGGDEKSVQNKGKAGEGKTGGPVCFPCGESAQSGAGVRTWKEKGSKTRGKKGGKKTLFMMT